MAMHHHTPFGRRPSELPSLDRVDVQLHVGRRMKQRRRILDLTQTEVAETIGVTFQTIHKYECAASHPDTNRLHQIARALGVSVGYFFEGL